MASSSTENVTSVAILATERHNFAKTEIKMIIEMTIGLKEGSASIGNTSTVGKKATGLLIVRQIKKKRKTMNSTTFLWEPHSVDKFKKITTKKISKNG